VTRPPVAPPGWPDPVRPPGAPDWERSAVAWLFDQCPPDYRAYDVLRRHPVVLAHLAGLSLAAAADGAERGLRTARHDLRAEVGPDVIEATLSAYERERHRLRAAAVGAELLGRALRGERWAARL
jgi:hypothetical protein